MSSKVQDIDSVITFIFLKKLMTPTSKSKAFSLGLVDSLGRNIKDAETDEERDSYTLLDKTIFKIKRLLGNKITQLHAFLYLKTLNGNSFYNKLVAKGSVESKAEIKRIKRDLQTVSESYGCDVSDLLHLMITEDIVENKGKI
jgi:hypothetical protein